MDKFDIISVLGEGAYGIVMKCRNKATGEIVAVKKFKEAEEDEDVRKTILREVKLLRALQHENIVGIRETFKRKGKLFIVFEYMEKNVLELLELYPGGLPTEVVRRSVFQLLKSLRHCHMNGIMHRDIKPENLLVKFPEGFLRGTPHAAQLETTRMEVKLCDFGFARMIPGAQYDAAGNRKKPEDMTVYVSTRWYRAPELLIGMPNYDSSVDLWATGCIMSELLEGRALFPGESDIDQLFLVQCCLGPLCDAHKEFFDQNPKFSGMRFPPGSSSDKTLKERVGAKLDSTGLDLLTRLLRQEPAKRPSASDALRHPYFADLVAKDAQLKLELASATPVPAPKADSRTSLMPTASLPVAASPVAAAGRTKSAAAGAAQAMEDLRLSERKAGGAASASGRVGAPAAPPTRAHVTATETAYEDDFEPEPSSSKAAAAAAARGAMAVSKTPSGKIAISKSPPSSADSTPLGKTTSANARTFVIDVLPEGEDESPGLFTKTASKTRLGGRDPSPDGIPSWEGGPSVGVPYRANSMHPRAFSLNIDDLDDQDWEEIDEEDGEFDKLEAELEEKAHMMAASNAARANRPSGPSSHVGASNSHRTWNVTVTLDGSDDDVEEETHYDSDFDDAEQASAPSRPIQRSITTPFPKAASRTNSTAGVGTGTGAGAAAKPIMRGKSIGAALLQPSAAKGAGAAPRKK